MKRISIIRTAEYPEGDTYRTPFRYLVIARPTAATEWQENHRDDPDTVFISQNFPVYDLDELMTWLAQSLGDADTDKIGFDLLKLLEVLKSA